MQAQWGKFYFIRVYTMIGYKMKLSFLNVQGTCVRSDSTYSTSKNDLGVWGQKCKNSSALIILK